mmetsp:Transcript_28410/g.25139  ORF Transcript_28410/g.25139 Transcript_28410/m.25139 type:complete len:88 (+) Transcript_28410:25-288(+)
METSGHQDQLLNKERKEEIIEEAKCWQLSKQTGDFRKKEASKYGGFQLRDDKIHSKLRSAGKEAVYRIGKQILSGKLNLISIAFPFK